MGAKERIFYTRMTGIWGDCLDWWDVSNLKMREFENLKMDEPNLKMREFENLKMDEPNLKMREFENE
jgi:hypothetical protein